ncbi:MAG: 16S rRNA (guanine(966)-N(2))-methyltransferase RsmD [Firmicutes bacterium]|nr:16S rRNA (guanine(966)-N(2))-methyltransferase RsmD [Bacillota bacterium]
MRVITGKYRGRKLNTPVGNDIRPTTDKAKEAMFSILTNYIYGSRVLDLFAGTGGLGIEALSRGAEYCMFCDASRSSLKLVKENLEHCKVEEDYAFAAGDYKKTLKSLGTKIEEGLAEQFDIVLMDPPYSKGLLDDAFKLLQEGNILADDGIIVAEHRKEEDLPEELYGFVKEKERRYGIVKLSIFRKQADEEE